MKKIFFLLCTFQFIYCFAQTKAVTENGDEVILYDNKTWDFSDKEELEQKEIPTNSLPFSKSKNASFFLKSQTLTKVGIYLNPKIWTFKKGDSESQAEYKFQLKDKDAYGMMISERIEIPLETLKQVAISNAKNVAPDIKITMEEYRTVNNIKLLCMQMDGAIRGVKFSYFGYYYSFEGGTIQLLSYTSQNLFKEYKAEIEEFLNGFVINY